LANILLRDAFRHLEADPRYPVFIGKPGNITNENIRELLEQALDDANSQGEDGYQVKDLRAFNVVFA
jgi:hypothetical protein